MKKIEIIRQTEKEKFVIERVVSSSPKNMLLMNLENEVKNE